MEHVDWAGFRFYDLIFPLFVFMAGASMTFSLNRIIAQHGRGEAIKRVLTRTLIIFALGVFYSGGLTNPWPDVRVLGVLQRIALAYGAAGILYCFFKPRMLVAAAAALLIGYWALMTFVPVRDIALEKEAMIARFGPKPPIEQVQQAYNATTTYVTGRYEPGLNVSNHFDFAHLGGRRYDVYWDPEGILSTLPAIATCLLGVFAGLMLRAERSDQQKVTALAVAGVVALLVGYAWSFQFPLVKKIWTSSFVLFAGGWSFLLLAAFYYVIDMRGVRKWSTPFVWIGMNPILLYVLCGVVLRVGTVAVRIVGGSVKNFFDTYITAGFGNVVLTAFTALLVFLLARFFYTRKIFLRV
jgi:predicted acyltransferase